MENNRLLEILHDRERCEFCADGGDDAVCVQCKKVKGISVDELRAYYAHLTKLVKARTDGRCKVGDNVYFILSDANGYLGYFVSDEHTVTETGTRGFWTSAIPDEKPDAMSDFTHWGDFGKTVFLTREEAEAALEDAPCSR